MTESSETSNLNAEQENQEASGPTLEEELTKAQAERDQWKDKFYYQAAEMENTRKRWDKEREQILKFGTDSIIQDTLPTLDLFELTVSSIAGSQDPQIKNIVIGLNMIQKQFLDSLAKHGLTKLDATDKDFDPNFHEAISQETVADKKPGTILRVQQSGYLHNGRLLRAAKVVVNTVNE
jgi:molecular chaperone GrpE